MRVVIAEDQVLLREGLARLFEDGGNEVVASMGNAYGLMRVIAEHVPDLVVLDIRMPPTFTDEGARAAMEVKQEHPELGVLLLSQHVETTHSVSLVKLGGFGYLLKDRVLDVGDFLAAADRVSRGGSALDPQVVAVWSPAEAPGAASRSSPSGNVTCSRSWQRGSRTAASPNGSTSVNGPSKPTCATFC